MNKNTQEDNFVMVYWGYAFADFKGSWFLWIVLRHIA